MSERYSEQARAFQDAFGTRRLADKLDELIVSSELSDNDRVFIESAKRVFIATTDHRGFPTCSHKGGNPGFIRVLGASTVAIPSYNGNGMFLTAGNIRRNAKIGLLFIDFDVPHRLRIHGTAQVSRDASMRAQFEGAELLIRIVIEEVFVNCPRYIAPNADTQPCSTPGRSATPAHWKRIDALQDSVPVGDRRTVQQLGGSISGERYAELIGRAPDDAKTDPTDGS